MSFLDILVNIFYTSLGAALFYSKWGRKRLKVYFLSDILDVCNLSDGTRVVLEFCIFIFFGCSVSLGIVHPQNAAQAFIAGLGWTGLVGRTK